MNERGHVNMNLETNAEAKCGTAVTNTDEEFVIRRCQDRDVSAFKQIFKQYEQPLLRSALRVTGNHQDAEDAVQTTFLKLYNSIGNFRFQSKFSTYLFRILLNTCYDIVNQKHRTDLELLEDSARSHQPEPGLKVRLEKAIEGLPQRIRACFVLFAIEGFSQKEISDIMEISVGTVKANIFRAKEKLRPCLAGAVEKESS